MLSRSFLLGTHNSTLFFSNVIKRNECSVSETTVVSGMFPKL
jgi:hypothetical protein